MTKIAIKGPASGTGSYTLNAPDTADTLDFELPTAGTHLASAQADGMPLGPGGDPVVESGSNTDGDWTRWADGTQIVSCNIPANQQDPTSHGFAQAFSTIPYISYCNDTIGAASTSVNNVSLGNFRFTSSTTANTINFTAYGRWK